MTYVLRFVPEVEDDAMAACSWHEEKAQGLGDEFLRTFYACAKMAIDWPYSTFYRYVKRRIYPDCQRRRDNVV
jgi:hypothetical protein